MGYKELDRVLLKDGREGTIVAVAGPDLLCIDVGDSLETFDNIFVPTDDVVKIISIA